MKNMEIRRQQALQRKAEEERKMREDAERRKREREEHTDKRPLKVAKKASNLFYSIIFLVLPSY